MELKQLKIGQVFELAGYKWIVLDHEMDNTLIVAKDYIGYMVFDEDNNNNFRNSTLRKYLNIYFLEELISKGLDEDSILFTDFDLSDHQGENSYGFCRDKIGLLTEEQYVKYRDMSALNDQWRINDRWWLITPFADSSRCVRTVNSDGSLGGDDTYYVDLGVRPTLSLKSDTTVSKIEGYL